MEDGGHDSERGSLNGCNEGSSSKLVDGFRNFAWLLNCINELGNEGTQIWIGYCAAHGLKSTFGGLLYFGLGVPHALGDLRDDLWERTVDVSGSQFGEMDEGVKGSYFPLPCLLGGESGKQVGEESFHTIGGGGDGVNNSLESRFGGTSNVLLSVG